MAVNNKKKNIQPYSGYYDESSFVSLVSSLRDASGDETPLKDEYVELNRNIYDMITPDIVSMNEGVTGIQYDTSKNALIINYSNGASNQIILTDNFLSNAVYLDSEKKARFIMGNGTSIDMDLSSLTKDYVTKEEVTKDYYTKDEVEKMIEENQGGSSSGNMEWGSF